jgi:protein dithiol oxidoreductase (disulfide-forming)
MKACLTGLLGLLLLVGGALGEDASVKPVVPWVQGVHYFLVLPVQPTSLPIGKVEVTEVFSYACPACNRFLPTMRELKQRLPANVVVDYVPASFIQGEDWQMFQRAYLTAQFLGVADQTHDAMFEAIWKKGELAVMDPATNKLKDPLPTILDAAHFYNRVTGIPIQTFLDAANSKGIDARVARADDLVMKYRADSTPTIVVNGKYRVDQLSARGADKLMEIVEWLVEKENQ